jgi:hypothetical protein
VLDYTGGPGFLAFASTFLIVVGSLLLFRSLSRHLRKVRTHPPDDEKPAVTDVPQVTTEEGTSKES